MMKPRITAVSYLNTLPFVYGLQQQVKADEMSLSLDVPSECARKLLEGEADMGLAPAGVWPRLAAGFDRLPYCIAADGMVNTVMLFSRVPLHHIRRVFLDQDSRTSVLLIRILAKHHWHIQPEWVDRSQINPHDLPESLLAIGDKAFALRDTFPYVYDLATEWKKFTGLPFVFAVWVATPAVPETARQKLCLALEYGISNIEAAIELAPPTTRRVIDLHHYLTRDIRFRMTDDFTEGLTTYLEMIKQL